MTWTSDGIAVAAGRSYSYKFSAQNESMAEAEVSVLFMDSTGNTLSEEKITLSSPNKWTEQTGEMTAPDNAAYTLIRLGNSAGSGSVWYDNVIFTETADPVATYIKITDGSDLAVAPLSGETANEYKFAAEVTDQYNNKYESGIVWSLDGSYAGITIDDTGKLTVAGEASDAVINVIAASAENPLVTASKQVTVVKKPSDAGEVKLDNGNFSETDENGLPAGWTNSDRELSMANSTFDSSVSGWKLNYTSYTSADTSAAMEWDGTVDHTGNSGGSARIFNADRAQGSMQISQNMDIVGGGTYDVSVWVKTDNVSTDSNVYATLIFYDENGSTIEENKNVLVLRPETGEIGTMTRDWTKLSGTVYVNPLAVKLRIDMRYRGGANNKNGTVWFDDLVVSKQAEVDNSVTYDGAPSLSLRGYGEEDNDVTRTYGEKWDSPPVTGVAPGAP